MAHERSAVFLWMKALANLLILCLMFPCAATCWLERVLSPDADIVFPLWTHALALVPGFVGLYVRRAFYRLTLTSCRPNLTINFGSFFSKREVHVEDDVYIGAFAVIGRARLGAGCLIGTRVSLLSGSAQHQLDEHGHWTASSAEHFREIQIGQHSWIGEGAIVMADVGEGSVVSAGAVVAAPVPAGVLVAGNPARFVRRMRPDGPDGSAA